MRIIRLPSVPILPSVGVYKGQVWVVWHDDQHRVWLSVAGDPAVQIGTGVHPFTWQGWITWRSKADNWQQVLLHSLATIGQHEVLPGGPAYGAQSGVVGFGVVAWIGEDRVIRRRRDLAGGDVEKVRPTDSSRGLAYITDLQGVVSQDDAATRYTGTFVLHTLADDGTLAGERPDGLGVRVRYQRIDGPEVILWPDRSTIWPRVASGSGHVYVVANGVQEVAVLEPADFGVEVGPPEITIISPTFPVTTPHDVRTLRCVYEKTGGGLIDAVRWDLFISGGERVEQAINPATDLDHTFGRTVQLAAGKSYAVWATGIGPGGEWPTRAVREWTIEEEPVFEHPQPPADTNTETRFEVLPKMREYYGLIGGTALEQFKLGMWAMQRVVDLGWEGLDLDWHTQTGKDFYFAQEPPPTFEWLEEGAVQVVLPTPGATPPRFGASWPRTIVQSAHGVRVNLSMAQLGVKRTEILDDLKDGSAGYNVFTLDNSALGTGLDFTVPHQSYRAFIAEQIVEIRRRWPGRQIHVLLGNEVWDTRYPAYVELILDALHDAHPDVFWHLTADALDWSSGQPRAGVDYAALRALHDRYSRVYLTVHPYNGQNAPRSAVYIRQAMEARYGVGCRISTSEVGWRTQGTGGPDDATRGGFYVAAVHVSRALASPICCLYAYTDSPADGVDEGMWNPDQTERPPATALRQFLFPPQLVPVTPLVLPAKSNILSLPDGHTFFYAQRDAMWRARTLAALQQRGATCLMQYWANQEDFGSSNDPQRRFDYVRASAASIEHFRDGLIEIRAAGLQCGIWGFPDDSSDYKAMTRDEVTAFHRRGIAQYDEHVSFYFVGLEMDEYWGMAVNQTAKAVHIVNAFASATNKPVFVHLTAGRVPSDSWWNLLNPRVGWASQISKDLSRTQFADETRKRVAQMKRLGRPYLDAEHWQSEQNESEANARGRIALAISGVQGALNGF